MANPVDEAVGRTLGFDFHRRLTLQLRGPAIISDTGLLPFRERDDAPSLTDAGADVRMGKSGRHLLAGLLR